jgi:phage-related protein (TIGR01555 family)
MSEKNSNIIKNYLVNIMARNGSYDPKQVNSTDTIQANLRYNLVTLNRQMLAYMYSNFGIIKRFIDQPVDDAFRGGITVSSDILGTEGCLTLERYISRQQVLLKIKRAIQLSRLFGGAALVVDAPGPLDSPLNINSIGNNVTSHLGFYAADMWELSSTLQKNAENERIKLVPYGLSYNDFYFYGSKVDKSRLIFFQGREATSIQSQTLSGWGLSELEMAVDAFNQYLKSRDIIFEIKDESKISVFSIDGLNDSLLSGDATPALCAKFDSINEFKSYANAVVIDKQDAFEQKQLQFSGLAEIVKMDQVQLAAALGFPESKIFGLSASGFASGEDDLENYNATIENDRLKYYHSIISVIELCCQRLFEFIPEDLAIHFTPLRTIGQEQENIIKESQFNRLSTLHEKGLISDEDFIKVINQNKLVPTNVTLADEQVTLSQDNLDSSSEDVVTNSKLINKIFKYVKKD